MASLDKIALLENLFHRYHPRMVAFAFHFLGSREDAKEIAQEVFCAVWNKIDTLQEDGNIKSYLFTTAYRKCLNHLQKKRLTTVELTPYNFENGAFLENNTDLETAELEALIFDEINRLPKKCRQVFLLSRMEALSYKEIADKLGITTKTVENHIGNALKRLKIVVEKYEGRSDGQ